MLSTAEIAWIDLKWLATQDLGRHVNRPLVFHVQTLFTLGKNVEGLRSNKVHN